MTIVSIDFDIIMAPSIEFYNHLIGKQENLFDEPLLKVCQADYIHYNRLTKWLTAKAKSLNKQDIIFIKTHEQLLDYIPNDETKISLINIDHHHDLGYVDHDEGINCGNWAAYLLSNKKIKDYTWIKNENSIEKESKEFQFNIHNLRRYDLNEIKPDKIIICLSEDFIPPQFQPLYYLWQSLLGQIHNTKYDLIENN